MRVIVCCFVTKEWVVVEDENFLPYQLTQPTKHDRLEDILSPRSYEFMVETGLLNHAKILEFRKKDE